MAAWRPRAAGAGGPWPLGCSASRSCCRAAARSRKRCAAHAQQRAGGRNSPRMRRQPVSGRCRNSSTGARPPCGHGTARTSPPPSTAPSPASGCASRALRHPARLPIGTFEYATPEAAPALSTQRASQVGPEVARVEGRYTLRGYDRGPRQFETHLTAVRRDGGWRLADDSDGGTQPQLWDLPDLAVVRSSSTLVVGSGPPSRLREYLRLGDQAVARVARTWTRPWGSRLVLVVPATAEQMAGQLGQDAASVEQVAAVTDGTIGADGRAGADRVVVNPGAFARLRPDGRRVVITHEATHVAIRASTTRPVALCSPRASRTTWATAVWGFRANGSRRRCSRGCAKAPGRRPCPQRQTSIPPPRRSHRATTRRGWP